MSAFFSHPLVVKFHATDAMDLFLANENIEYKDNNHHVIRREFLGARADREMHLYKMIHYLPPAAPLGVHQMYKKGILTEDEFSKAWAEETALGKMVRARLPSFPCHAPPLPCMR